MPLARVTDQYIDRYGVTATRVKVREGSSDGYEPTVDDSDTESITVVPDARSPSVTRFQSGPDIDADLIVYIKSDQTIDDADESPDGWADRIRLYNNEYEVLEVIETEVHLEQMRRD